MIVILGAILALLGIFFGGPIGMIVAGAVLFGLVLGMYRKTAELHADVKKMKAHMGLMEKEELERYQVMANLEEARRKEQDPRGLERLNRSIEEELDRDSRPDDGGEGKK